MNKVLCYIEFSFLIIDGVFFVCFFRTFLKYELELNPSSALISSMESEVVVSNVIAFSHRICCFASLGVLLRFFLKML